MEVFLIPTGRDRHELYCEVPDEDDHHDVGAAPVPWGYRHWWRRLRREAREAHRDQSEPITRSWTSRARRGLLRWIAERIAEQRLLWHLRGQHEATLGHPEDMPAADAMTVLRKALERDRLHHVRWLAVDAVGLLIALALIIIPGPNLILYYFGFRVVGHYLSMLGARQGLRRVQWRMRGSAALSELRSAVTLEPPHRAHRVKDIESRLQLQHLARFVDRTAVTS